MGLHPESRHKTSFSCEYGTFQYRVLPMGLLTTSAAFQRWVEGRLKKHNLLWQEKHDELTPVFVLQIKDPTTKFLKLYVRVVNSIHFTQNW